MEKKIMKKIKMSLLLGSFFMLSILNGCGGSSSPSTQEIPTPETAALELPRFRIATQSSNTIYARIMPHTHTMTLYFTPNANGIERINIRSSVPGYTGSYGYQSVSISENSNGRVDIRIAIPARADVAAQTLTIYMKLIDTAGNESEETYVYTLTVRAF